MSAPLTGSDEFAQTPLQLAPDMRGTNTRSGGYSAPNENESCDTTRPLSATFPPTKFPHPPAASSGFAGPSLGVPASVSAVQTAAQAATEEEAEALPLAVAEPVRADEDGANGCEPLSFSMAPSKAAMEYDMDD